MKTTNILLNKSNIVTDSKNSRLIYKFPASQLFENSQIGIHSLQMYYSWFNINEQLYNNNKFQYKWWSSTGVLNNFTVTIPNGYYSISSINLYFQGQMLKNGHYLVDGTTVSKPINVFFIEFVENPSYYAIQLNILPMYTALPTNWTKPSNFKLPTTQSSPIISILEASNFKDILGFNVGQYPPTNKTTLYQKVSDYTPAISPISSLIIRCNIARNMNALPNDVIYSFTKGSSSFGGLIVEKPSQILFTDVIDGRFEQIELSIYDQNYNPVEIIDPDMLITMIIKT